LSDRKNNFRSFIYGQSSTNPTNFAKIGPVDVEIIGMTEITKIFLNNGKNKQQNKQRGPLRLRFAQSGWANE